MVSDAAGQPVLLQSRLQERLNYKFIRSNASAMRRCQSCFDQRWFLTQTDIYMIFSDSHQPNLNSSHFTWETFIQWSVIWIVQVWYNGFLSLQSLSGLFVCRLSARAFKCATPSRLTKVLITTKCHINVAVNPGLHSVGAVGLALCSIAMTVGLGSRLSHVSQSVEQIYVMLLAAAPCHKSIGYIVYCYNSAQGKCTSNKCW